jgi:membrane protease subunit (stomatin/prohibitin family)
MNFNFLKRQLASVIEWTNQQPNALLFKFPSENDEIKNASKLIVGPGQGAILAYEGSITGVLTSEGLYDLETDNHPFITTFLKLRTAFESEHKLKVYFFRTAENVDQNWGTAAPIKYLDPIYEFPVTLGANGNFSFRLTDAGLFFGMIAGLSNLYTTLQAKALMQSRIAQIMTTQLATAQFSYQQIDAQLDTLSDNLKEGLLAEFAKMGLALTDFRINGTVFDKDTQARIKSIADVSAESQAAHAGGLNYMEFEKLKALRDAAKSQGGLAAAGLQFGAGIMLGKLFTGQKDEPPVTGPDDPVIHLQKLKQMLSEGIITQKEFDDKKKEWLDKI